MHNGRRFLIVLVVLIMVLAPLYTASSKGTINRSKIRSASLTYPVRLKVGDMVFKGTLSRAEKLSEEEIAKAIKEALDHMEKTELDIIEAQEAVERGERANTVTKEDVDRVLGNVMKLAGVDNIADLIKAVGGTNANDLLSAMEGLGADQAKEKAVSWLLEQATEGAGEAAGTVTKLLDMALISGDQYERDQDKWKARVEGANAQRLLNEFYYQANYRLDSMKEGRTHAWVLQIDDTVNRNFVFFSTEGNLQIWTVNLLLRKYDTKQSTGPSGTYTGVVVFSVEYEMSSFDEGFADWAINKSGMLDAQKAYFEKMRKIGVANYDINYGKDDYDNTYVHRTIDTDKYSKYLLVPIQKGSTKAMLQFDSLNDTKEISIRHKLPVSYKTSGKVKYDVSGTMEYTCQNEDVLNWNYNTSNSMTVQGKNFSGSVGSNSQKEMDPGVWDLWDKEKWLEISYP